MTATVLQAQYNQAAIEALAQAVGGQWSDGPYGPEIGFGPSTPTMPTTAARSVVLSELGLLRVSGADAVKFLHSQLTNDLDHLPASTAQWTGYCTAKGRLLVTALAWRDGDAVLLLVSRPLAESLRKRLSMFVLRAKAKVEDVSDQYAVIGILGADLSAAWQAGGLSSQPAPDQVVSEGAGWAIGLAAVATDPAADAVLQRGLLVVHTDRLAPLWQALRVVAEPAAAGLWRWTEVRSGVPRIVPVTSESFVPQMVNFELVNGVNFKKGCYPGQEVVARSQYLGKLKRRMYAGRVSGTEPQPGVDVFSADGSAPIGTVVMAAPDPSGGYALLFESPTSAVTAGGPRVGTDTIAPSPLPYAIPGTDA